MSNGPEAPAPQPVAVTVNVKRERHWVRNAAFLAGGALALSLYQGCEGSDDPVRHGDAQVDPYAALSHVRMPINIETVQGNVEGGDSSRIYTAACTFKIPNPLGKDPQACTGDIGFFNGDTDARVDGQLTLVALNKSMFVSIVKDKSDFGYYPLTYVNKDRFALNINDPVYTNDDLNKGVGNSMKQVAIHKFNDPEADEADYVNWLNLRASNAVKTACVDELIPYVPDAVRRITSDWLLGGIKDAENTEDVLSVEWLRKLSKQVVHIKFVSDEEYNELLSKLKTGTFEDEETTSGSTRSTSPSSEIITASTDTTDAYMSFPDPATGISVEVPAPVPSEETYTFTIMGGTKKFTEVVSTESEDCDLSLEDKQKLEQLKQSGTYVLETDKQRGGF